MLHCHAIGTCRRQPGISLRQRRLLRHEGPTWDSHSVYEIIRSSYDASCTKGV